VHGGQRLRRWNGEAMELERRLKRRAEATDN
jgi:hypothetical protein